MDFSSRTKKEKSVGKMLLATLIAVFITGCAFVIATAVSWKNISDRKLDFASASPYRQPGSVWESDDPKIVLRVSETSDNPAFSDCTVVIDGEEKDVVLSLSYPELCFMYLKENGTKSGEMMLTFVIDPHFTEDKIELIRIKYHSYVFDGKYERIVLYRMSAGSGIEDGSGTGDGSVSQSDDQADKQ